MGNVYQVRTTIVKIINNKCQLHGILTMWCINMVEDDELEEMMMAAPSAREIKKKDHEMLNKAVSHPLRRKLVKSIGVFGKTKDDVQGEMDIDDASFKYQTEFLVNGTFLKVENGLYKLTDKGLDLLANIN